MSNVRISVIIPAYNAEPWLAEAVRSVLEQTVADLEVIVVNDGSKDGTLAVARSFADPRVTVIDKPNGGVSTARNAGIDVAKGTYIAFLDADDKMWPANLEAKVDALERGGVDWVYGDIWRCDAQMQPMGEAERGTDGDVVRTILSGRGIGVPGISSNVLAHRRCFDAGVRFDPNLSNSADQDIALSLGGSFKCARVPLALSGYRVLSGSMSRNIALYEKDHLYLFQKAKKNGLFGDAAFQHFCFANAYWAIGGSWWKNAGDRKKAIPYFVKAILLRPALLLRPFTRG